MVFFKNGLFFSILPILAVPGLQRTLFIDTLVMRSLPSERRIVRYTSKQVAILAVKGVPEIPKNKDDKAQRVITT